MLDTSYRPTKSSLSYLSVRQFSKRDKDYMSLSSDLSKLVNHKPILADFEDAIEERKEFPVDRSVLVEVVSSQYKRMDLFDHKSKDILSLNDEHTFTVCTAHQPVLFGGPLYTIYKAISAINLAEQLKTAYPNYHFVPIYIMGSEDHDFEEMNHCQIFNKDLIWDNDEIGPVGRMSLSSLQQAIDNLKGILGQNEHAEKIKDILESSLRTANDYGEFSQSMFARLFLDLPLLVIGMDEPQLKKSFIPKFIKEITEQASIKAVQKAQKQLESLGYSSQAHAREINIFYMGHGGRDRIIQKDGKFHVHNTELSFSKDELMTQLNERPEEFSPNVILRPIFQESILPNLCYIGGGGELAYWMERKEQFEIFNTFYPILMRRNSAMILPKSMVKIKTLFELSDSDLLKAEPILLKEIALKNASVDPDFSNEREHIEACFRKILEKSVQVEKTLEKPILAELNKSLKSIGIIQGKLIRAMKQKQEVKLNKVRKLLTFLFPGDGLQERTVNFLQFYMAYGPEFINALKIHLDPFENDLIVLSEA